MINNKDISSKRKLGRFLGYLLARYLSQDAEPVYIMGIRIHHYLLLFAADFFEDEFLKGAIEGAGAEDLPDLLDDYAKLLKNKTQKKKLRDLADNLRRKQGKQKK